MGWENLLGYIFSSLLTQQKVMKKLIFRTVLQKTMDINKFRNFFIGIDAKVNRVKSYSIISKYPKIIKNYILFTLIKCLLRTPPTMKHTGIYIGLKM